MSSDLHIKSIGNVVRPQKVAADRSVVQSVVDFFNDVLPQGTVPHKTNDKEVVSWIRIDQPERLGNVAELRCPVYVTFGYANGAQIWAIEPHGEAWEVYSSRQGPVKAIRLLPLPEEDFGSGDLFAAQRPLMAICDGSSNNSQPFTSISFLSLSTGKIEHTIKLRSVVENIFCNQRVLVVTFPDRFVVYDACSLAQKERAVVHASFPFHLVSPNPVALGKRWIAYSESKLNDVYQSRGGRSSDGIPSYTASVLNAAKSISQGISNLGEAVAGSIAGTKKFTSSAFNTATAEEKREGIVTIIDLDSISDGEGVSNRNCVIAHFLAHATSSIAALAFNADGTLVLTVSQTGQNFHLFRILPHPAGSSMAIVQHLYTLHRGDTNATLQDISFSLDSRWVAVTSMRATTHVFPITPYGGPITYRTHSSSRVVNKISRFMKSAGLDELDLRSDQTSSLNKINPTAAADVVSPRLNDLSRIQIQAPSTAASSYPVGGVTSKPDRQFPAPVIVQALSQIKHSGPVKSSQTATNPTNKTTTNVENIRVATCFSSRKSRVGTDSSACDALLIATSHGALVEYSLQPVVAADIERISEDVPVGLSVHAQAQWILNRHLSHVEFSPPFMDNHPLLNSTAFSTKSHKTTEDHSKFSDSSVRGPVDCRIVNIGAESEPWLSQVEIVTHAGPARRLWMGPQFRFAPISTPNCQTGLNFAGISQAEIQRTGSDWDLTNLKLTNIRIRSAPVSMPISGQSGQYPMIIEAGSGSFDKSIVPDSLSRESNSTDDLRLSEIADAMHELSVRDHIDGRSIRTKANDGGDDSPEDLSASSTTESVTLSTKSNHSLTGASSPFAPQASAISDFPPVFHSVGPNETS